ncbi:hypothetical protein QS713_01175 [Gleimia hominis]|uniref:Beta-carotene 15,15'-monooxygenase n=1 Tax=Gleimia hominis TaxID=595468 RepID=A0ABU3I8H3_9ACTO|nr:DUF6541 family protein [Gleimia hominis]MDT3766680.1 hypothetical protein [Gleimia hominis]
MILLWLPALMFVVLVAQGGWVRSHAANQGPLFALAVAPLISFGFITVLTAVFSRLSPLGLGSLANSLGINSHEGLWRPTLVFTSLGVLAILGAAWARTSSKNQTQSRRDGEAQIPCNGQAQALNGKWTFGWLQAVAVGLGVAGGLVPLYWVVDARNPLQQWDPSFHLNAVYTVSKTHEAFPIGALDPMMGHDPSNTYYPDGWHAFTALFTPLGQGTGVAQAVNASSVVLVVCWVVGMAALLQQLRLPRRAQLIGIVLAGFAMSFPADFISMYAQWPNAFSIAMLPALITVSVHLGRILAGRVETRIIRASKATPSEKGSLHNKTRSSASRGNLPPSDLASGDSLPGGLASGDLLPGGLASGDSLPGDFPSGQVANGVQTPAPLRSVVALLAVWLVAAVGAVGLHPISFFNAFAVVVVPVVAWFITRIRSAWQRGARGVAGGLAAVILVLVGALAGLAMSPLTRSVGSFARDHSWGAALIRPFMPAPPFPTTVGYVLYSAGLVALIALGLRALCRRPITRDFATVGPRWLAGSWLVFAFLLFLANAPDFGLRFLAGPWYTDGRRIAGAMMVVVVPLAALGVHSAWRWCVARARGRRWMAVAVPVVVALVCVLSFDTRVAALRTVYDPQNLGKAGMASAQELQLARSAKLDGAVIGDPSQGTVYFQALGGNRVLFPQLSITEPDKQVRHLVSGFKNIHSDQAVCAALRKMDVRYFFESPDRNYYSTPRSKKWPGFYGVDTSKGFEVVAQAGESTLYRITACGL